jgi:hypothetical protein
MGGRGRGGVTGDGGGMTTWEVGEVE